MIDIKDIYWLAGFLEGEGCFQFVKGTVCLTLGTTDYDIMIKFKNLVDPNGHYKVCEGKMTKLHRKTYWTYHMYGHMAASWMMTLYSLLGIRRQEKIRENINKWMNHHARGSQEWKDRIQEKTQEAMDSLLMKKSDPNEAFEVMKKMLARKGYNAKDMFNIDNKNTN